METTQGNCNIVKDKGVATPDTKPSVALGMVVHTVISVLLEADMYTL